MRVRSDDFGASPGANPVEHFLVDGVAPPVIGEGPPEPEPWDDHDARHARETRPPRHVSAGYDRHQEPGFTAAEPPTSPIPVIRPLPPEPEPGKRRSWVAKVLRLPGS